MLTSQQRPALVTVVRQSPSSCQPVKTAPEPRPRISLFRYQCQLERCQTCILLHSLLPAEPFSCACIGKVVALWH